MSALAIVCLVALCLFALYCVVASIVGAFLMYGFSGRRDSAFMVIPGFALAALALWGAWAIWTGRLT